MPAVKVQLPTDWGVVMGNVTARVAAVSSKVAVPSGTVPPVQLVPSA